ncbi:CRISPR-associated endonuclease Cas2 [Litorilinea aerophila]|uniref:CRISPR-associated endoribonuclease Cas2 n=1 Tax=Litorilinea aerophila TaxID=1204385 RepID=A0A540VA06_9CHLR|nr:CRISPR-associated endonuclease Cas2 [Litorilinea aerophila]MCC9078489.1 CRISPR-associated endonuclease Cas2 [Litorilinea aerophila]OUC05085.1 CRISPR-associated protein Cas2 [Litorilinea aerophila]
MMVLITYDVNTTSEAGKRRLRLVAKQCRNFGQRVQNSVFECLVDAAQMKQLKHRLVGLIDPERDSLRFYYLGNEWRNRVEHVGTKASIDLEGPLIA